ncbi:MAG: hypothetical protein Q4D39_02100 [Coriobacteriaceae bacterium]|nr:hypothetical protein [Coriobacteriaceae bacterium]
MGKTASILTACVVCALSLGFVAPPALADIASPVSSIGGFLGVIVVAVGALRLIFKRKH